MVAGPSQGAFNIEKPSEHLQPIGASIFENSLSPLECKTSDVKAIYVTPNEMNDFSVLNIGTIEGACFPLLYNTNLTKKKFYFMIW